MKEMGCSLEEIKSMTPRELAFRQAGLDRWYRDEAAAQRRMFRRR